jgi:hypothetical protein
MYGMPALFIRCPGCFPENRGASLRRKLCFSPIRESRTAACTHASGSRMLLFLLWVAVSKGLWNELSRLPGIACPGSCRDAHLYELLAFCGEEDRWRQLPLMVLRNSARWQDGGEEASQFSPVSFLSQRRKADGEKIDKGNKATHNR